MIRCPRYHTPSDTPSQGKDCYYCHKYKMEFDPEDDSDIGYGRP